VYGDREDYRHLLVFGPGKTRTRLLEMLTRIEEHFKDPGGLISRIGRCGTDFGPAAGGTDKLETQEIPLDPNPFLLNERPRNNPLSGVEEAQLAQGSPA
jgi:hypothetical protein